MGRSIVITPFRLMNLEIHSFSDFCRLCHLREVHGWYDDRQGRQEQISRLGDVNMVVPEPFINGS